MNEVPISLRKRIQRLYKLSIYTEMLIILQDTPPDEWDGELADVEKRIKMQDHAEKIIKGLQQQVF